jgi:hypothetical protein
MLIFDTFVKIIYRYFLFHDACTKPCDTIRKRYFRTLENDFELFGMGANYCTIGKWRMV